ncbi:lymphatic vessel endothelial hyaluronic acid receptor 1-like [Mustelus asterias]
MKEWGILTLISLSQTFLVWTQTSVDIKDIDVSECRIMGVFHVGLQGDYKLSQAQAHIACHEFGTVLATKAQVEQAHQHGFETCRYGWVEDGFTVIPRISSKEQCGKNRTGVVTWKHEVDQMFDGYCFRSDDAHKTNTCEPLIRQTTTTILNPTETEMDSTNTNMVAGFSSETIPLPDAKTTRVPREINSFLSTSMGITDRSMATSGLHNTSAIVEDHHDPFSVRILYWVLGALIIALLVILIAGVYYIRKRKKNSSYRTGQPKEAIEAEVWNKSLIGNSSP